MSLSTTSKILLIVYFLLVGSFQTVSAWYDSNAVGTAPDWSYRVPINIPAGATVNSTIKFDVDFTALIATLGVGGTFDINSPRVVRSNGVLASTQEYTDTIYNSVLDATTNGRGEIKFILQDTGPSTYYLYFDTTVNGVKPVNPRPTINGNFEHSIGATPTNWTVSSVNAGGNQNNEVHDTAYGSTISSAVTCGGDQALNNVDTSPNNANSSATTTGRKWHLNGYRNNCEDGTGRENINLSKTFAVPSTNSGNMTFYFQLQAYDNWDGASKYDYFKLSVNGAVVDHTNLGINNTGSPLLIVAGGLGRKDPYSPGLVDAGWKLATLDLSPYAGTNITIMFTTDFHTDAAYRTWIKLDDIEWSIRSATLGTPEAQSPILSMQKTSQVISDGINATNPKRIPGAIVKYTITAKNSGYGITDNNSVIINDAIPANTALYVNDISGAGTGPIRFVDGTPASGLSYNYVNLASTTDGLSFSNDGGTTYTYTPTPDVNGVDTAVTNVKMATLGSFLATSGAGSPNFQFIFRVQVQ